MPRDFENYSISYALWNIGDYFWRLYREDLKCFAENRTARISLNESMRNGILPQNANQLALIFALNGHWQSMTMAIGKKA